MAGPYEQSKRDCFVRSVLGGQPAEFITRTPGTEGESVVEIWRFTGTGPIRRYIRDFSAWIYIETGIEPRDSELRFAVAGIPSEQRPVD